MIDITIILYITSIVSIVLSVLATAILLYYITKLKDVEIISDVINMQNSKIADIALKMDLISKHQLLKETDNLKTAENIMETNQAQPATDIRLNENKVKNVNDLEDMIIKSLKDKEMSSTEIQRIVGKTREHVSRTLKKMVEEGVLERDGTHKPYKYRISAKSVNN